MASCQDPGKEKCHSRQTSSPCFTIFYLLQSIMIISVSFGSTMIIIPSLSLNIMLLSTCLAIIPVWLVVANYDLKELQRWDCRTMAKRVTISFKITSMYMIGLDLPQNHRQLLTYSARMPHFIWDINRDMFVNRVQI